jgi:hypothetical protein
VTPESCPVVVAHWAALFLVPLLLTPDRAQFNMQRCTAGIATAVVELVEPT